MPRPARRSAFLLVHRKLDSFRGDSALGTWIYRLATNCCVDFLRSRQHRRTQATDTARRSAAANAAGAALRVEHLDLERAIARLPPGYRSAFVLRCRGLRAQRSGGDAGIAEGASKSQVHKARMRLARPAGRRAGDGPDVTGIMNCDAYRDRIDELVDGTLDGAARRELDAHLATCAECRALAEDLLAIRRAANRLPPLTPPDRIWQQIAPRRRSADRGRAQADAELARAPGGAAGDCRRPCWRPSRSRP